MLKPSRDLSLEPLTDVDVAIGDRTGEEPDRLDGVRRRLGSFQRWERQAIARQWINGVESSPPDDSMIAMAKVGRQGVLWIVGEEDVRLPATNPVHQVAPQFPGVLDGAIKVIEKGDLGHAKLTGGLPRLGPTSFAYLLGRIVWIARTTLSRGDEQ